MTNVKLWLLNNNIWNHLIVSKKKKKKKSSDS